MVEEGGGKLEARGGVKLEVNIGLKYVLTPI